MTEDLGYACLSHELFPNYTKTQGLCMHHFNAFVYYLFIFFNNFL